MLFYGKALLADHEDAERLFLQGLGPAAKKWPFLRGRLLLAYGGWLRRQRRSANARAPLREARDIFDALGASPWSDRAREELRASGEASRRRAEPIWETLTPQELHIAQLASDGLSNKEIGARIFVSPNGRLSPAPDFLENRHHLPVRAGPHPRWSEQRCRLTANLSSDWSFDRSDASFPCATSAWCNPRREKP